VELNLDFDSSKQMVKAYGPDFIQIGDTRYTESLRVSPAEVTPWGPRSVAALDDSALEALLEDDPNVVILGTGNSQQIPPVEVIGFFAQRGIGFEFMDTPAACRTYNILAGEGRRVVAGLILET